MTLAGEFMTLPLPAKFTKILINISPRPVSLGSAGHWFPSSFSPPHTRQISDLNIFLSNSGQDHLQGYISIRFKVLSDDLRYTAVLTTSEKSAEENWKTSWEPPDRETSEARISRSYNNPLTLARRGPGPCNWFTIRYLMVSVCTRHRSQMDITDSISSRAQSQSPNLQSRTWNTEFLGI